MSQDKDVSRAQPNQQSVVEITDSKGNRGIIRFLRRRVPCKGPKGQPTHCWIFIWQADDPKQLGKTGKGEWHAHSPPNAGPNRPDDLHVTEGTDVVLILESTGGRPPLTRGQSGQGTHKVMGKKVRKGRIKWKVL